MALEITDQSINELLSTNELVVIDFWAEWCAPCRMMGPAIDDLANENKDVVIGKLNVTDNAISPQKFTITGIPCIVFIKNGEEVGRLKGAVPKSTIQAEINKHKN